MQKRDENYATQVRTQIDAHLVSKLSQPVGIIICDDVLSRGASYSAQLSVLGLKNCNAHEVSIIGRRTVANGKTEYLIRNSWGKSCNGYAKGFTCVPGIGVWIDSDAVARNVQSISWIDGT